MKNKLFLPIIPALIIMLLMMSNNLKAQLNPDKGIGPVKSIELGPLNKKMSDDGKALFANKCTVCHDLDQKKLGPALRNITTIRTPEYLMNLLVNITQMQKEDALMKEQIKKFNNLPMTNPGFNQTQARAVVEYLRSVVK